MSRIWSKHHPSIYKIESDLVQWGHNQTPSPIPYTWYRERLCNSHRSLNPQHIVPFRWLDQTQQASSQPILLVCSRSRVTTHWTYARHDIHNLFSRQLERSQPTFPASRRGDQRGMEQYFPQHVNPGIFQVNLCEHPSEDYKARRSRCQDQSIGFTFLTLDSVNNFVVSFLISIHNTIEGCRTGKVYLAICFLENI